MNKYGTSLRDVRIIITEAWRKYKQNNLFKL